MDEDDRITGATFLEIELCSGRFDIWHIFSSPSATCASGCRDKKTDRVAIGRSRSSHHCVAWRSITGSGRNVHDSHQLAHAASAYFELIISRRRICRLDNRRRAGSIARDLRPATTRCPHTAARGRSPSTEKGLSAERLILQTSTALQTASIFS